MKKKVELKVYGVVQGVFYRARACEIAKDLGLAGYVKNEPDGSVEIVAEGEENTLKSFIEKCYNIPGSTKCSTKFCNTGIPNAKVKKIDAEWGKAEGEYSDFEIKY
jgi:acylphosphatase